MHFERNFGSRSGTGIPNRPSTNYFGFDDGRDNFTTGDKPLSRRPIVGVTDLIYPSNLSTSKSTPQLLAGTTKARDIFASSCGKNTMEKYIVFTVLIYTRLVHAAYTTQNTEPDH